MVKIRQAGVEIREEWGSEGLHLILGGRSFASDEELDLFATVSLPIDAVLA